ncbi:hypothetical protein [uncultured Thiothrix sp.]|uniref:hypothetical protein n=1 Tax=uncultured Thiothrix sp. TaxID=223185 RepID=UPI00262FAD76|nr:hypothetical protein [uncultured Thiothrix sp.]
MKNFISSSWFCSVSLLTLLAWQQAVVADWECPVGVDPNGPNNTGVACVWYEDEQAPEDEGDYHDGGNSYQEPAYTHYDSAAWGAFADMAKQSQQELANFRNQHSRDPAYRELQQGTWDFVEAAANASQTICQASFLSLSGGVIFMDNGEATFLGFYGASIPPTQQNRKLRLSLTQSGETQTVQAFHTPYPLDKELGMYMFAVPSTQALLDSIEEQQDFAVALNGKTVVQGVWHSGTKARNWLRQCVAKRG